MTLSHLVIKDYQGSFNENNQQHGEALCEFYTGNHYKGTFMNGAMSGKGTYTWTDGVVYIGDFKDNKMQGQGSYTWYSYLTKGALIHIKVKLKMD